MDAVEIVMEIEELFGIEVSDEQLGEVWTVGDLCRLVENASLSQGNAQEPQAVYEAVERILSEQLGVVESDIHEGAELVRDLGMD